MSSKTLNRLTMRLEFKDVGIVLRKTSQAESGLKVNGHYFASLPQFMNFYNANERVYNIFIELANQYDLRKATESIDQFDQELLGNPELDMTFIVRHAAADSKQIVEFGKHKKLQLGNGRSIKVGAYIESVIDHKARYTGYRCSNPVYTFTNVCSGMQMANTSKFRFDMLYAAPSDSNSNSFKEYYLMDAKQIKAKFDVSPARIVPCCEDE